MPPAPKRTPSNQGHDRHTGLRLIPAAHYSIDQLTDIYNRARTDYLVPMPMSPGTMRDYLQAYDIDLERSVVAIEAEDDEALGLAMLGVRGARAWISRLGVLPTARKHGLGEMLVDGLLRGTEEANCDEIVIEVISDNGPALRLFGRAGFEATRELLVARRPPDPVDVVDHGAEIRSVGFAGAMRLLEGRSDLPSWATETQSMRNAGNVSAIVARWPNGDSGWLAYANSAWKLSRLVIETERGDSGRVGRGLLQQLHWRHPLQDTVCENISLHDAHWPAMQAIGYLVAFRRVEMRLLL